MGGGKKKTVYRTQSVPNDYDDAWIREKFGQMDQQALGFANWQAGRQASLGREERIRDELQSGLSGLSSQQAAAMANIENLQRSDQRMSSDFQGLGQEFAGLSQSQQQQMKDLYNLSQQEGSGVEGVRTGQGLTFTRPRVSGTSGLNRQQLQTSSLNI